MSAAEQRKANETRGALLGELRAAQERMQARMPGSPAIAIPLNKVLTFQDDNGEPRGIIEVEQVIYLVDEILRRGREKG